jgi:hypothetical protein
MAHATHPNLIRPMKHQTKSGTIAFLVFLTAAALIKFRLSKRDIPPPRHV